MKRWRLLFVLMSFMAVFGADHPCRAHGLHHESMTGEAVVITFFYENGSPLSFQQYEIFVPGGDVLFQEGRTDRDGRIAFLPDRQGSWRIRTFTEDGHGSDFLLEAGPSESPVAVAKPLIERYGRLITGLGIIFGLFGIVCLFTRRKR